MEDIKQLTVKGVSYNIKDEQARQLIAALHNIQSVFANITGGYGTPSVDVQYANDALTLTFHNLVGNGITSIQQTASPNEDEGVNRYLVTMNDGSTTELTAKNGHRGNGIVSIEQIQSSQADNGENIWQITDTDGNVTNIVLYNGHQPSLTDDLGDDSTIAMSQKGVTNAVLNIKPIEFEKFYISKSMVMIGSQQTAGGATIEAGKAKLTDSGFSGYTFVWHQYLNGAGSSFDTINARVYLKRINGEWELFTSAGETITAVTATDMLFNLNLMFGTHTNALPRTQEQFQALFPAEYYEYSAPRLMHTTVSAITSSGIDANGDAFHDVIDLPVTSITGKRNGVGESVVIFPEGMEFAPTVADSIYKEDGIWKATKTTANITLSLTGLSWTSWGQSYYHRFEQLGADNIPRTSPKQMGYSNGFMNAASSAMNGTDLKGFFAILGNTYSGGALTLYFSKSDYTAGLPSSITIAYALNAPREYVLDDEWQVYLNTTWNVSTNGIEQVFPSNGNTPVTTPINMNISYPVIDYEVKRICVENWGGNYIEGEITYAEAADVTTLNGKFRENTTILRFNELQYFKKLTSLYVSGSTTATLGQFYNCGSIEEVTTSPQIGDFRGAFRSSGIVKADLSNCTASSIRLYATFRQCYHLEEVKLPGSSAYAYGWEYCFQSCSRLKRIDFDGTADLSGVTSFATNALTGLSALTTITGTITGINVNMNISSAPLTTASALILVNGLSSTGSGKTLTLKASQQATYEADADFNTAVTAATANGWTIAYA